MTKLIRSTDAEKVHLEKACSAGRESKICKSAAWLHYVSIIATWRKASKAYPYPDLPKTPVATTLLYMESGEDSRRKQLKPNPLEMLRCNENPRKTHVYKISSRRELFVQASKVMSVTVAIEMT